MYHFDSVVFRQTVHVTGFDKVYQFCGFIYIFLDVHCKWKLLMTLDYSGVCPFRCFSDSIYYQALSDCNKLKSKHLLGLFIPENR